MVCDTPYIQNEFGDPSFFYVFNLSLSFSTCSQSFKKICTWKLLGANVLKVALNPIYRIYLNFAKSYILSCLSKFYNKKNFTVPFLKYKSLKLKLRVFLAGHSVAMVTYSVAKIMPTCSPVIRQVFDTMVVASIYKERL